MKRKCLFPEEYPLKVSDKYTVGSCISDCRVRYFIDLCGCIPFFYPHLGERISIAHSHSQNVVQCKRVRFDAQNGLNLCPFSVGSAARVRNGRTMPLRTPSMPAQN